MVTLARRVSGRLNAKKNNPRPESRGLLSLLRLFSVFRFAGTLNVGDELCNAVIRVQARQRRKRLYKHRGEVERGANGCVHGAILLLKQFHVFPIRLERSDPGRHFRVSLIDLPAEKRCCK